MKPHVRNGRPSAVEAKARRDELARLVAEDMRQGGLDQACRNIVHNVRSVRLNPERALRLSYDPSFVAQVEKLVGFSSLKQSPEVACPAEGESGTSGLPRASGVEQAPGGDRVPGDLRPGGCLSEVAA